MQICKYANIIIRAEDNCRKVRVVRDTFQLFRSKDSAYADALQVTFLSRK